MGESWYKKIFLPASFKKEADPPSNAGVQFGLGLKFANGEGVKQDYPQAIKWYRKAAEQNHVLAQFNLGMMYRQGQGVPADRAESVRWFGRAAAQGDAGAQFNLGLDRHHASVRHGAHDVAESRIEAYKWYRLAAAQGYRGAEGACENMMLLMTREDIATGNARIVDFQISQAPVISG